MTSFICITWFKIVICVINDGTNHCKKREYYHRETFIILIIITANSNNRCSQINVWFWKIIFHKIFLIWYTCCTHVWAGDNWLLYVSHTVSLHNEIYPKWIKNTVVRLWLYCMRPAISSLSFSTIWYMQSIVAIYYSMITSACESVYNDTVDWFESDHNFFTKEAVFLTPFWEQSFNYFQTAYSFFYI